MKKVVFTLLLICFAAVNSFSQNRGFISLSGMSGPSSIWSEADNKSDILGFGLDFKIGYHFRNNFQLSTGISWLKTGFSNRLDYALSPVELEYYESYKFTQLLIPVELGYSFRLGDKFWIIPSINIGLSHPLSGSYFSQTDNIYEEKFNTQRLNNYNSFTFWAGTGVHLTYDVTERIGLTGGFQFNSMVSDFRKISVSGMGSQMMYVLGGDIGIRYNF
jgi:hypothetical protein